MWPIESEPATRAEAKHRRRSYAPGVNISLSAQPYCRQVVSLIFPYTECNRAVRLRMYQPVLSYASAFMLYWLGLDLPYHGFSECTTQSQQGDEIGMAFSVIRMVGPSGRCRISAVALLADTLRPLESSQRLARTADVQHNAGMRIAI